MYFNYWRKYTILWKQILYKDTLFRYFRDVASQVCEHAPFTWSRQSVEWWATRSCPKSITVVPSQRAPSNLSHFTPPRLCSNTWCEIIAICMILRSKANQKIAWSCVSMIDWLRWSSVREPSRIPATLRLRQPERQLKRASERTCSRKSSEILLINIDSTADYC